MKKLLLTVLLLTGCKNMDENGRLEKVRFSVPAFFHVEMEYYACLLYTSPSPRD